MKSVIVEGVTPLHYRKRTVEELEIGDAAWISVDGRIAHPVLVCGKDATHYSVMDQCDYRRYGVWRGCVSSLYRDEVRTTPRLACENMITF